MALTNLTDAQVRALADRVLGQQWRDLGYDHAESVAEDDVYGEAALSVTVWLASGSPAIPTDLYENSLLAFRDAVRAEGEDRYAYVHLSRPDDPIAEAESDAP